MRKTLVGCKAKEKYNGIIQEDKTRTYIINQNVRKMKELRKIIRKEDIVKQNKA